jgi:hypothetical protein
MTRLPPAAGLAAALALAAGCSEPAEAPWLTMPSTAHHTARWFPTQGGTVHEGATCDDCHGAFPTFREFDCLHCHTGSHTDAAAVTSWHAGVQGFAFDSAACYGCHKDGRGTFANHAAFFPIEAGTRHETAGCADCHLDRANRLLLGCAGCHAHELATMEVAHGRVAGYAFESALCVRCHAEAQRRPVTEHAPFRIAPGAPHAGPDAAGACLVCHPTSRADKPWATDFVVFTCVGCHDPFRAGLDASHAAAGVVGYDFTACHTCHPTGSR